MKDPLRSAAERRRRRRIKETRRAVVTLIGGILFLAVLAVCLWLFVFSGDANGDQADVRADTGEVESAEDDSAAREAALLQAEEERLLAERARMKENDRTYLNAFLEAHPEASFLREAETEDDALFAVHADYVSRFDTETQLKTLQAFETSVKEQDASFPLLLSADIRPDGRGGFLRVEADSASALNALVPEDHVFTRNDDGIQIVTNGDFDATQEELDELTAILKAYPPRISFKAVSLDGRYAISYHSADGYFSACTIKGPYLHYCYETLRAQNADLEEEMIYQQEMFNGGTGSIRLSPPGTAFTTRDVLYRTAWESDNTGYKMLYFRFGYEEYNQKMTEKGCPTLLLPAGIWSAQQVCCADYIIAWSDIYDFLQDDNPYARAFYDSLTPCEYSFFGEELQECVISQKYGQEINIFGATGVIRTEGKPDYLFSLLVGVEGNTDYDRQQINRVIRAVHELMIRQE